MIIDLSVYDSNAWIEIDDRLIDGLENMTDSYSELMEWGIKMLDDDGKTKIGFCVCNFMYFFRALSKNQILFEYFQYMVDTVVDILEN